MYKTYNVPQDVFLNALKKPQQILKLARYKLLPIVKSLPIKLNAYKTDNPYRYALDGVTINVDIPHHKDSENGIKKMKSVRNDIIQDFNSFWEQFCYKKPCLSKIMLIDSKNSRTNRQIKFDIGGQYFSQNIEYKHGGFGSTSNMKDDIAQLLVDMIPIQEFLHWNFENYGLNKYKKKSFGYHWGVNTHRELRPFKTAYPDLKISKIDICRNYYQKKTNLKSSVFVGKQFKRLHIRSMIHAETGTVTGLECGFRGKKHFNNDLISYKVYDKDLDLNTQNKNAQLLRFGSYKFLRKEWSIKRKFFTNGKWKLSTLHDFYLFTRDDTNCIEMLKNMRLNKDSIFNTDGKGYRALHDEEVRKNLRSPTLSIWDKKKIYQKRVFIFNNKVPKKNVIESTRWSGAYKLIKGTLTNHYDSIKDDEFQKLWDQMLEYKMRKEKNKLTPFELSEVEKQYNKMKINK